MIKTATLFMMMTGIFLALLLRLADSIEEENHMLEAGEEAARFYNEALAARLEKIRRFRHDAIGILQAIDIPEAKEISGRTGFSAAAQHGLTLLAAIIRLKQRQCEKEGIAFTFSERGFVRNELLQGTRLPDETDLCLLVQNLLQNAYEANLRIDDRSRRMMSLTAEITGETLKVICVNRIKSGERPSFITRKDPGLHGIGMKVIDDIAAKYRGSRSTAVDEEENTVTMEIILELPR